MGGVLKQDYNELEIILVENFSTDNSWEICKELEQKDKRIIILQSKKRGTSVARKAGIEKATGKYILFMDQDDKFFNHQCIRKMYESIIEDGSQICQFGYWTEYMSVIRRKKSFTNHNLTYNRETLFEDEIKGIFGINNSRFNTTVWNKIYEAEVLKNAINRMNLSLYYAEDEYLNICAFFDESVKKVSVRKDCYYVWKSGVGFSSSLKSNLSLFEDYEKVKPVAIDIMHQNNLNSDMELAYHIESVYFFKATICEMIRTNVDKATIYITINKLNGYSFIKMAKKFFKQADESKLWDELKFMSSNYSVEEYYEWCLNNLPKISVKRKLLNVLKRFM